MVILDSGDDDDEQTMGNGWLSCIFLLDACNKYALSHTRTHPRRKCIHIFLRFIPFLSAVVSRQVRKEWKLGMSAFTWESFAFFIFFRKKGRGSLSSMHEHDHRSGAGAQYARNKKNWSWKYFFLFLSKTSRIKKSSRRSP